MQRSIKILDAFGIAGYRSDVPAEIERIYNPHAPEDAKTFRHLRSGEECGCSAILFHRSKWLYGADLSDFMPPKLFVH